LTKKKKLEYILIVLLIVYVGAMGLEFSVFNLRYWTTSFITPSNNALEYEGYTVERINPVPAVYRAPGQSPYQELRILNIDHPVRTVHINPQFGISNEKMVDVTIRFLDESRRIFHHTEIIRGYAPSNHISIGAKGNVDYIVITIHDPWVVVDEVYLNTPMPFRFQWVRVFLVTFVVSVIWFWKKFGFSKIPFNSRWRSKQRLIDGGLLAFFIAVLFFVMYFSVDSGFIPGHDREVEWAPRMEGYPAINALMVDALLMGQLHLDIEPHESLLNAARPHSITYRYTHGIESPWDHVFFEGKVYSYFGIVPVVLLFLPYYVIRGVHLSVTAATFIFSAIGVVGVYFLWKALAKKYLNGIPFTLYLAGLAALLFGSNLMLTMVRAYQYEAVIACGVMFCVWGIYFIFRAVYDDSYSKIRKRFLVLGGACLALAVGARPTMLVVSLIVPVLMLPFIRSCFPIKNVLKDAKARANVGLTILALAIPYVVIGGGLAWYNYARFGSIFEFGTNYQITAENVGVVTQSGLLGNVRRTFDGFFSFLLTSFNLRPHFPYAFGTRAHTLWVGNFPRTDKIGAFMLPITWFLPAIFYLRKNLTAKKAMHIVKGLAAIGLLIAVLSTVLIGPLARYSVDFYWLLMFASVLCMGLVYKEACKLGDTAAKYVRHFSFVAVGVTCFLLFGWGMVGESNFIWRNNPVVFRFLHDLFMIF